jgi:chromosome segregation ATPase
MNFMFGRAARLEKRVESLEKEIERLRTERDELDDKNFGLRSELKDLRHQKKVEEEDLKHMVKIKEEKLDIEHQKKGIQLERAKDTEVAKVKDEYRNKIEKGLEERNAEIRKMYSEILERLPNVSVRLKGAA